MSLFSSDTPLKVAKAVYLKSLDFFHSMDCLSLLDTGERTRLLSSNIPAIMELFHATLFGRCDNRMKDSQRFFMILDNMELDETTQGLIMKCK